MGHILMENRNGLVVDVAVTHAIGTAEREAALEMLQRSVTRKGATVGANKGYDCKAFVKDCRRLRITPHVASKAKGSAIDDHTKRHEDYRTSLKVRKRIEEAFGWLKTVGGLAKTKLIGHAKLADQALMCFATYNLVRLGSIGVGGMRIMREHLPRGQCARQTPKGGKSASNGGWETVKTEIEASLPCQGDKKRASAVTMRATAAHFSTAC